MNKILILLFVLPCLLALKPSVKNALRNQVIIDFKNAMVPIISKEVEHMKFPDTHSSHSGFKIDISNIHIDVTPFHPNQINIGFIPNTSSLKFHATGFKLKGGAHISAKWHIIHKKMNAEVDVHNLGLDSQVTFLSNNGKLNIKADHVKILLSAGDVHIKIHGDIINKIIEFVANHLKGHFMHHIVSNMESKIPKKLTDEMNKKLNSLPSDINIGNNMQIHYSFAYPPFVKQDYLFTGINVFIHPKGKPTPPTYDPPEMPEHDPANVKGVQFFISDYVVKSGLDSSFALGILKYSFEKELLGHYVKMECKATKPPSVKFENAIDSLVDAGCVVVFDKDEKNTFTLIAELHVNLKEYAKQAVVFFSITEAKFTKMEYKVDHPVDIEWFKNGINSILDVLIQIINADLGQRGIPLPTIHGIDYTDMVEFVKNGYLEVCANPKFIIALLDN